MAVEALTFSVEGQEKLDLNKMTVFKKTELRTRHTKVDQPYTLSLNHIFFFLLLKTLITIQGSWWHQSRCNNFEFNPKPWCVKYHLLQIYTFSNPEGSLLFCPFSQQHWSHRFGSIFYQVLRGKYVEFFILCLSWETFVFVFTLLFSVETLTS